MHTGTKDCEDGRRYCEENKPANLPSPLMVTLSLCRFIAGHTAHLTLVPGS